MALRGGDAELASRDTGQIVPDVESVLDAIYDVDNGEQNVSPLTPFGKAIALIRQCHLEGIGAGAAVTSLLKMGVNLKGLDVGVAVAMASQQTASDLVTSPVVSLSTALLSPRLRLDAIAALPDEEGRKALQVLKEMHPDPKAQAAASQVLSIVDGADVRKGEGVAPSILQLWLARQLLRQERYEELQWLTGELESAGAQWFRHAAKLQLWSLSKQRRLSDGLSHVASWLLKAPQYAFELPR